MKPKELDWSKPVEPIIIGDNVIVGYKNVEVKPKELVKDINVPHTGIDFASKLSLYGKITEKHAEEINEMINVWVNEAKKEVIDHISFNEGWEETGDKYRKYFGIEPLFNQAHWNEETETNLEMMSDGHFNSFIEFIKNKVRTELLEEIMGIEIKIMVDDEDSIMPCSKTTTIGEKYKEQFKNLLNKKDEK